MQTSTVHDLVADFIFRVGDKKHDPWQVISQQPWWPCPETGHPLEVATPSEIALHQRTLSEFAFYAYAHAPDYVWAQRCIILLSYSLRSCTRANLFLARTILREYYEPRLRNVPLE